MRTLTKVAWPASRKRETYLSVLYRRLVRRRGKKKAAIAVSPAIPIMAYHILKDKFPYRELGAYYSYRLNITYVKH